MVSHSGGPCRCTSPPSPLWIHICTCTYQYFISRERIIYCYLFH